MLGFSPFPPGKRFAVTFVDDTDFSTVANTRPVYDLLAEHGFWGTKTVWPLRGTRNSTFRRSLERHEDQSFFGATLEDREYAAFVARLQEQGFEIALHDVAAGNSTREEIVTGLARFSAIFGHPPALNAFHYVNIENLYCGRDKLDALPLRVLEKLVNRSAYEGHLEGSTSFWGDIARDTFRYVRLPFHTIDEINTLRVNPSMPFHDPSRPYVRRWFAASDGGDVLRFNRLLSAANVERLAHERGVCVIYTHFAKNFAPKRNGYRLEEDFVPTVKRVTATPGGWFAPATAVLDRLSGARALSLTQRGYDLIVKNCGEDLIEQPVLTVPDGVEIRMPEGEVLPVQSGTVALPSLSPGYQLRLMASRAGEQTIQPTGDNIDRRERRRIEYLNYVGLVRGAVRDRLFYRRRQLERSWSKA
jgi:hypothetical protein